MNDHLVTIVVAIIVALGSGGIGAAAFNWLTNKKKAHAESEKIGAEAKKILIQAQAELSAVYEIRLLALTKRAGSLETKVEQLEAAIDTLKQEKEQRDSMIDALTEENKLLKQKCDSQLKTNRSQGQRIHHLTLEIEKVKKENAELRVRIKALEEQRV